MVDRAAEALWLLSEPSLDRPEGIVPADSVVDVVAWQDDLLHIELTLPLPEDHANLSPIDVELISTTLAALLDPHSEGRGLVVWCRRDPAQPYRLLEEFVPVAEPGVYVEPDDVAPPVDAEPGTPLTTLTERDAAATTISHQPTGALTGVVVYAAAGHGWTAQSWGWALQRPLLLNMVEDYGNIDQLNYFVEYCFNAGATVVPFRPVGYQVHEIVLDQDDPEVTYSGAWINSTGSPYYENNRTISGIAYRFAVTNSTQTAFARYTPNLPTTDAYPVYTWVLNSSNRTLQKYRIVHTGGASEVTVDHRLVGKGWVWLGNYHFNAGTSGYVEISNQSTVSGNVIADAIRFGNGMGDIVRPGPGTISGYSREEECQRYWAHSEAGNNASGMASSIWDGSGDDGSDNVGTGARWAREMNNESIGSRWNRVYLEFHTNASTGAARGTIALITGSATTNQALFADIMGEEIEEDMQLLDGVIPFEYTWATRGNTYTSSYGAISTTNNSNEFDATIIEVAYHDNTEDAALLLDPKVRDAVGRSSMHGIIKFLNSISGGAVPLTFPPDRPRRVQAVHNGTGGIVLSWQAPLAGEAYGGAATGYRVYRSSNGYGFDAGQSIGSGLSTTLTDIPANTTTYLRITATNAGGESMPSETLAVRRPATAATQVLIVNGFDRVGRLQDPTQTIPAGTMRRPILRRVNSFDYTIQHAAALAASDVTFDSCTNEAVIAGTVSLAGYDAVVWILGEESTADRTFDATEQALVTTYLNGGGGLFVSGAEIGWDLDYSNNGQS
ncbi:MAG: N-acetylmuramoyl-L-alanine amidase, partial [Phycisphaerae bacterium]|nr:N-acetylmuramoyl-L-alanine amidase [Phycisphaerae bacterium]